MKKYIAGLVMAVVCASGAEIKLEKNVREEIPFEMTRFCATCTDDRIIFEYVCEEPEAASLKVSKKNPAWDTFRGEAVELYFTPSDITFSVYGQPDYRFRVNSYNTFLQTFLGSPKWRSRYISSHVTFSGKEWTATITIPFAALETEQFDAKVPADKKVRLPKDIWTLIPGRSRNITGESRSFAPATLKAPLTLRLPRGIIEPYRSIAFKNISIEKVDPDSGKTAVSFILANPGEEKIPFHGKAVLMLSIDGKPGKIAETNVACEPGEEPSYKIPFSVKESGNRYSANLEIHDSSGKIVRASRNLDIDNPWVDFQ